MQSALQKRGGRGDVLNVYNLGIILIGFTVCMRCFDHPQLISRTANLSPPLDLLPCEDEERLGFTT